MKLSFFFFFFPVKIVIKVFKSSRIPPYILAKKWQKTEKIKTY